MFFYRHYYENNITYTKNLLFEKTNIESFDTVKEKGLVKTNFLVMDRFERVCSVEPTIY